MSDPRGISWLPTLTVAVLVTALLVWWVATGAPTERSRDGKVGPEPPAAGAVELGSRR